jgi:hypothetical protein
LRTALYDLDLVVPPSRQNAIRRYAEHLDVTIRNSILDSEDLITALQQDRQGLGLSRKRD